MPDVGSFDNQTDWMHACVPAMMDEGREQEQAVAACLSMWRRKEEDGDKATWTVAYQNNLPDSAFLYVEPGQDKDEEGKTVPRSARHFPYKGADGAVDLPHLRNAIQRIPQSNAPGLSADKKRQLQDRARKILEDANKTKADEDSKMDFENDDQRRAIFAALADAGDSGRMIRDGEIKRHIANIRFYRRIIKTGRDQYGHSYDKRDVTQMKRNLNSTIRKLRSRIAFLSERWDTPGAEGVLEAAGLAKATESRPTDTDELLADWIDEQPWAIDIEPTEDTKAGRRLRGDWLKKLKDLKAAAEAWLKGMSDMEAWAAYADDEDEDEDKPGHKTAPMLFKAKDGKTWLLTWTTNAFIDRDKELFSTKSIEEYVARHEGDETKGKFELWHLPGTEFGTIRWQAPVGRFLVEAGPFDATPVGDKFKAFFEAHPDGHESHAPGGWATSHGYSFKEGDRDDGVYDWFEKYETSVLPFEAAANQHNPQPEVISMNDKQKALLREIGGDELVEAVIKTGEAQTKALEEQGIAYKAEEKPEEKPAEAPAPAIDVKAIVTELHLDDLSETIKAQTEGMGKLWEMVKSLQAELAEVKKQDEKRVAEKMADIPRFSWFRGSQAASTVLNEDNAQDAALKAKKPTPGAIQAIAAKMGGGS